MKYGTMTYISSLGVYNAGDYIQSLAAMQYLPRVDSYLNREQLDKYQGDKIKMILNGWFMHMPENWPPSPQIDPLFVSFHMNHHLEDAMLKDGKAEYLKKFGPIGCRDLFTANKLQKYGIDAYYSSCLTTTLDLKYKSEEKDGKVYVVDPLWLYPNSAKIFSNYRTFLKSFLNGDIMKINSVQNTLKSLFTKDVLADAEYLTQVYPEHESEELRFKRAEDLLHKYAKARLVITSRIHCALPCLALGTPVIFLNSGFNSVNDQCRFDGIVDILNTINISDDGEISSNFDFKKGDKISLKDRILNPTRNDRNAALLKARCSAFINENLTVLENQ